MSTREILIALVSTIVGGVAVWIVQQIYLNRRENQRLASEQIIKHRHRDRVITDEIFIDLAPRKSIALMKELLGAPKIYSRVDFPVFADNERQTHSYLYLFSNGMVKVTSVDNETIDTLTVFADNSLSVDGLFFPCEARSYKLDEVTVCAELIDESEVTAIQTIRDSSFAIKYTVGPPITLSITCFGHSDRVSEYRESQDAKEFVGERIEGVCVSQQGEDALFSMILN